MGAKMRILLIALLTFSAQNAFAIPSATPEQCAIWAKIIAEYNDKYRQGGSLDKRAYYRNKVDEYEKRRRAARCRAR